MKKFLSIVIVFIMIFGAFSITASAQTAVKTQAEAVAWLETQEGATYDFDGQYGTQCTEFVKAYVNWLVCGNAWTDCWNRPTLDGGDIWQNSLWTELGWEVYYNTVDFVPQRGDIFSAGLSAYTHTGVVISSDASIGYIADANGRDNEWSNGDPVYLHNVPWSEANSDSPYGVTHFIRPIFKNPCSSHSFNASSVCTKCEYSYNYKSTRVNFQGFAEATEKIYVRKSPYEVGELVDTYPSGTELAVTGKVVNGYGHEWYVVLNDEGNACYERYVVASKLELTSHTCQKGDFDSSLEAHPHYNSYKCKICNKRIIDYNSSNFSANCDQCMGANITTGTYAIKNSSTGTYICVSYGADANKQNVDLYSEINSASKMIITPASKGYKIRPECCASRLINPFGDVVTSGLNINIYDDMNDSSQWWLFQRVSGGYVIRNVQNPNCVLDTDGNNVFISTYTGASTQIWTLCQPSNPSLVVPSISFDKSSYVVGDTITISWVASPSGSNLSHYWVTIIDPSGNMVVDGGVGNSNTSHSFTPSTAGTYSVKIYATPIGSQSGEGSLTDTKTVVVNAKQIAGKLATPTGLEWNNSPYSNWEEGMPDDFRTTGVITWNNLEGFDGEYDFKVFCNGVEVVSRTIETDLCESEINQFGKMMTSLTGYGIFSQSGTYTFAVKANGVNMSTIDSDWAYSDEYEFVLPKEKLSGRKNFKWVDDCELYHEAEDNFGTFAFYRYRIYDQNKNLISEVEGSTSWDDASHQNNFYDFFTNYWKEHPENTKFYVTTKVFPTNIELVQSSDWSEFSPTYEINEKYYYARSIVEETLDCYFGDNEPGGREPIDEMFVKFKKHRITVADLAEYIKFSETFGNMLSMLSLFDSVECDVNADFFAEYGVDIENHFDLRYLTLNSSGNGPITIDFTESKSSVNIDRNIYKNIVAVDVEATGLPVSGELKFPIKVSMDLPDVVSHEDCIVLQYMPDGSYKEIIPQVNWGYDSFDEYYASATFVLTNFSQFVICNISDTLPDNFEKYVQIVDGEVKAPGLHVESLGDRTFKVTLSGIRIKDKYIINRSSSKVDSSEYSWGVKFLSDSNIAYSVSTDYWAFEPGLNEEATIDELQHSVWLVNKNSGHFIADTDMSYTSHSITWTFTIPYEDYDGNALDFDFSETTKFEVRVKNVDSDSVYRVYNVGEKKDSNLADTVEFTSLKSTSLAVGKTLTLKATASRSDGKKPQSAAVTYEIIEGKEFATIDAKGKLTANAVGEVAVRATAEFGTEEAYADITINICIPATKVTLNKTTASMMVDGTLQLIATMAPNNNTDSIKWTVDKEDIATVDENGVVTAHKAGKVKVTATTESGKKATCTITVGAPADTVTFSSIKSTSLAVGKTLTLSAKASCEDGTKPVSTAVVYEIINGQECATIDAKGKLKGVATGEVVVRARAEAGTEDAYADVAINVCIPATKVTLNMTKATMIVGGEDLELVATMAPANTSDTLKWSVDKPNIATVDENSGLVTALSAGKVKVTATAGSGKSASCTITIGAPADTVTFSSLKTTSLAVGKTLTLSAKASCADKTKPVSTAVVYEIIEGKEYATIDAKGKLKGIATGEVVVRARAEAGTEDAYADVAINVCIPATKVTLNMTKATMIVGGEDLELVATMAPTNTSDTLTWSVDKSDIATVDKDGVVTAHKAGKVKVTAKSGSGKSASCTVTIGEPATAVEVTTLKVTSVALGKTLTLKGKAVRSDKIKPVSTAVVFEIIEGNDLATIDAKGKLTANKEGNEGDVVVRISAEAGTEDAYEDVTIKVCTLATKVTLSMSKATLSVGDELQLEVTMAPDNNTDTIIWSVDKPNIATVDENGLVTTHSAGKVKVTAKSGSGKSASCTITVTK